MKCEYLKPTPDSPCVSYLKPGMCSRPDMFRCTEYIANVEPSLSYSGVNSFMKCPRAYYWSNIRGLQMREDLKGDALKIGTWVDNIITADMSKRLITPINELWMAKVYAMVEAFYTLGFNINGYTGQLQFLYQPDGAPQVKGYIDLSAPDNFIELKCTIKPDYYLNPYWVHDQLGTYFLSNDNYNHCIVWAIRTPSLKQTGIYKGETLEMYKDRCVRDMLKRPVYYFPGYDKDNNTFGVKFYRAEFDLDGLKRRYRWIADEIKNCVDADYWYQNRVNCINPFQCDYIRVCDTGGISEDVYEYRKKGGRR